MDISKIRLVISQPAVSKTPSEWDCDLKELDWQREYANNCAKTVWLAVEMKKAGENIDQFLRPGEKQCTYCKARADCHALAKTVGETVMGDFEVLKEPVPEEGISTPIPTDINLLASYYLKVPLIEIWIKAVSEKVVRMTLNGEIGQAQGLKVVAGKRGNKAWDSAEEVEAMMKEMRIKQEDMYSMKLISPTQAEKVLSENPRKWKKLQDRITQADGSPSVVHISDKRPALNMKPEDDFEDLADDLC